MREDTLALPVCVTKGLVLTRRLGRRLTRTLCGNKMLVDLRLHIYFRHTCATLRWHFRLPLLPTLQHFFNS